MRSIKLLLLLIFSISSFAAQVEIVARANNYGSFNMPEISFISNATIKNNTQGDVAFNFLAVLETGVHQAIWLKNSYNPSGKTVHVAEEGHYISDPSLNEHGDMVFSVYNELEVIGLYKYSYQDNTITEVINPGNKNFFSLRDPIINNGGTILFRLVFTSGERTVAIFKKGELRIVASDKEDGIAYLFSPSFINGDDVAMKVREGESLRNYIGDTIRVYKASGEFTRVNGDSDFNNESIFLEFNNALGTHFTSKYMAYIAKLKTGEKTLVRQVGSKVEIVATEGMGDIAELEYFSPAVNNAGDIAFRAIKSNGKRAIFYFDGKTINEVLTEGDTVFTNESTGVIHTSEGPVFGGSLSINESREIMSYGHVYTKYLERSLGSAVFKITP